MIIKPISTAVISYIIIPLIFIQVVKKVGVSIKPISVDPSGKEDKPKHIWSNGKETKLKNILMVMYYLFMLNFNRIFSIGFNMTAYVCYCTRNDVVHVCIKYSVSTRKDFKKIQKYFICWE